MYDVEGRNLSEIRPYLVDIVDETKVSDPATDCQRLQNLLDVYWKVFNDV